MKEQVLSKITAILILSCFLIAPHPAAQNEIEWVGSYGKGLSTAKKEKKFVMLYFHREDLDSCKKFTEGVFSNHSIATRLNKDFVSIDLDFRNPTATIHQIATKYDVVNQYPAVVFLNYDGREFESLKMHSVTTNFRNESVDSLLRKLSHAIDSIAPGIKWESNPDTAIRDGRGRIKMVMNVIMAENDSNSDIVMELVNDGIIWREYHDKFLWTKSSTDDPKATAGVELIDPYTESHDAIITTSLTNLSNDLRRKFDRFQKKYKNKTLWNCQECYDTVTDKNHGDCTGSDLKRIKAFICGECGCLYPEGKKCHTRAGSIG